MLRRHLLRVLAWLPAAGVGGRVLSVRALEHGPGLRIQDSPVAGFQYHQGERVWPHLRTGQPVALVREPRNPYDPRAVRIDWRGHKLGYLPRVENTAVAQMLDRGEPLTARIHALTPDPRPWRRVRVGVWWAPGSEVSMPRVAVEGNGTEATRSRRAGWSGRGRGAKRTRAARLDDGAHRAGGRR